MIIDSLRVRPGLPLDLPGAQPRWDSCGAGRRGSAGAQSGFTLVEATMALVLLGMAAAGVLLPFSQGAVVQAEGARVTLAAKLAGDLMERIIATPFDQIVGLGDGYSCTESQGQVTDARGVKFTDPMYANFSRDVTYRYAYPYPVEYKPLPDFVLVIVQVHYQGREIATLNRMISR